MTEIGRFWHRVSAGVREYGRSSWDGAFWKQRPPRHRDSRDVSDQPLAFSKDVCLFILDDVGIVFSEPTQEIYELNTTATFIWCQLEEGLSEPELAEALAGTFDFARADGYRFVREALAVWRSRGFFGGEATAESPSKSRISDNPPAVETHPMPGIDEARDVWSRRCYRILDDIYRVSFGSSEIESWVHPVLAHLEIPDESALGQAVSYYVIQDREAVLVGQLERRAYYCRGLNAIASLVKMVIFSDALAKTDESIAIHAAAVGQGRMALVLPGRAGSGKSTLTAALVDEGLEYLSDDLIMLNADLNMMRGVPFSLSVKESGTEVLSGRFPYLRDLPLNIRPDSKRVRYLPLAQAQDDRGPDQSCKIGWIVFPTYDPEGTDELLSIGAGAALVRLMESCTMMRFVSTQSVGRLVALLGRVPCFEMRVSSLDRATNELLVLCQDTPRKES